MNWKRIGRSLAAFFVVLCLLINMSPIKAEATVVGTAAVTGAAAAGVLGWLFAAAMGVVITDVTWDLLTGIGNDVTDHVGEYYGDDTETSNTVTDYLSGLSYDFGGSGDGTGNGGGDEEPSNGLYNLLPAAVLSALIDWAKGLIQGDGIEVEDLDSTAPEGFCYYYNLAATNIALPSVVLPEIPSGYSFCDAYVYNKNGYYRLVLSTAPIFYDYSLDPHVRLKSESTVLYKFVYYNDGGAWVSEYPPSEEYSSTVILLNDLVNQYFVWTSLERLPSEYLTEVVCPDLYIGDIPQQVQDGTFEEEKYELPYINYQQLFQGQTDAVEALNNVATQLQDQTMTYEQYIELIKTQVDTNTGTDTDVDYGKMSGAISSAVKSLFVPSEGYIDSKIQDLSSEYSFANSIALTAKDLRTFLVNLGSVPPVIRIDLSAATGSFDLGPDMVFIDFSFYEPYKPAMDNILSAFLWLWFVWRVILGLPGIIGGLSGMSGAQTDASHVGVTGSIVGTATKDTSVFSPSPGSTAHVNNWLRARNDANYKKYHGGKA